MQQLMMKGFSQCNWEGECQMWRLKATQLELENQALKASLQKIFFACSPHIQTVSAIDASISSITTQNKMTAFDEVVNNVQQKRSNGPLTERRMSAFDEEMNAISNVAVSFNNRENDPSMINMQFQVPAPMEKPKPLSQQPQQFTQPTQPQQSLQQGSDNTVDIIKKAVKELHGNHMKDRAMPYIKVKKFILSEYNIDVGASTTFADALRDALSEF